MWRADDDLAIAEAELGSAEELAGVLGSAALDADDMAAKAQEELRAAEGRAAWSRAVAVVARRRRERSGGGRGTDVCSEELGATDDVGGGCSLRDVGAVGAPPEVAAVAGLACGGLRCGRAATAILAGGCGGSGAAGVVQLHRRLEERGVDGGGAVSAGARACVCGVTRRAEGAGNDGKQQWRQFDPGG